MLGGNALGKGAIDKLHEYGYDVNGKLIQKGRFQL